MPCVMNTILSSQKSAYVGKILVWRESSCGPFCTNSSAQLAHDINRQLSKPLQHALNLQHKCSGAELAFVGQTHGATFCQPQDA